MTASNKEGEPYKGEKYAPPSKEDNSCVSDKNVGQSPEDCVTGSENCPNSAAKRGKGMLAGFLEVLAVLYFLAGKYFVLTACVYKFFSSIFSV